MGENKINLDYALKVIAKKRGMQVIRAATTLLPEMLQVNLFTR